MKHLLTLIALLAFTVCAQAQFLYRPTAYTAPFVATINSQSAAQTYLGLSPTNLGTFRFRVLFRTNMVFFPSLQSIGGTSVTYTTTNYTYGGGTVSTNFLNLTLPALMTTNSMVGVMAMGDRTNAITANVYWDIVLGTNLCTASGTVGSTTTPRAVAGYTNPYGIEVFRNNGSFTQQIVNAPSAALTGSQTVPYDPASYVDTSAPWNMTVGLLPNVNATPSTNILIREFMLVERWIQ